MPMQQQPDANANETWSILESAPALSQVMVTKQFTDDNLRKLGRELGRPFFRNDYNLIALGGLVEQFVRKFDGNTNAAVRCTAPAHVAAVDRHSVARQSQRVGHGRIVVGDRPVVLDLGEDREGPVRSLLLGRAVENDRGSDLVAWAKDRDDLRLQVNPAAHPPLREV